MNAFFHSFTEITACFRGRFGFFGTASLWGGVSSLLSKAELESLPCDALKFGNEWNHIELPRPLVLARRVFCDGKLVHGGWHHAEGGVWLGSWSAPRQPAASSIAATS